MAQTGGIAFLLTATTVLLSCTFRSSTFEFTWPTGGCGPFPIYEVAAIRTIQTVARGESQYLFQHGVYAAALSQLGADNLVGRDLAMGVKQGYKFVLAAAPQGYTITAVPVAFGSTGSRTFYSDQSMSIRYNAGQEPAGPASPELT